MVEKRYPKKHKMKTYGSKVTKRAKTENSTFNRATDNGEPKRRSATTVNLPSIQLVKQSYNDYVKRLNQMIKNRRYGDALLIYYIIEKKKFKFNFALCVTMINLCIRASQLNKALEFCSKMQQHQQDLSNSKIEVICSCFMKSTDLSFKQVLDIFLAYINKSRNFIDIIIHVCKKGNASENFNQAETTPVENPNLRIVNHLFRKAFREGHVAIAIFLFEKIKASANYITASLIIRMMLSVNLLSKANDLFNEYFSDDDLQENIVFCIIKAEIILDFAVCDFENKFAHLDNFKCFLDKILLTFPNLKTSDVDAKDKNSETDSRSITEVSDVIANDYSSDLIEISELENYNLSENENKTETETETESNSNTDKYFDKFNLLNAASNELYIRHRVQQLMITFNTLNTDSSITNSLLVFFASDEPVQMEPNLWNLKTHPSFFREMFCFNKIQSSPILDFENIYKILLIDDLKDLTTQANELFKSFQFQCTQINVLEIGAGDGEFGLRQCKNSSSTSFILNDLRWDRTWQIYSKAKALGIKNVLVAGGDIKALLNATNQLNSLSLVYTAFPNVPLLVDHSHLNYDLIADIATRLLPKGYFSLCSDSAKFSQWFSAAVIKKLIKCDDAKFTSCVNSKHWFFTNSATLEFENMHSYFNRMWQLSNKILFYFKIQKIDNSI